MQRTDIFFLTTFLIPRTAEDLPIMLVTEWTQVLGEDPFTVTQRLEKTGLVERASLALHLQRKFNVEELKVLLEQRALSTSGTKKELILRLINADYEGMSNAVTDLRLLQCSDKGRKLVEEYLQEIAANPNAAMRDLRIPADKFGKVIKWLLAAVASGVLGNIAYDALKELWGKATETPYAPTPTPVPPPPSATILSPLADLAGAYTGTFSTNSTRFRGTYNATLTILEDGTGTLTVQGAPFYNATVNVQATTQTTATIAFNDMEGDRIKATLAREGNKLHGSWKYATGNPQHTATGEIDVSKTD